MAHSGPARRRTGAWTLVAVLLLIAVLGTLIVPIYARSTPKLGSFPFFYWYQLLWVPIVAILTAICYLISVRIRRQAGAPGTGPTPLSAPLPGPGSTEEAS